MPRGSTALFMQLQPSTCSPIAMIRIARWAILFVFALISLHSISTFTYREQGSDALLPGLTDFFDGAASRSQNHAGLLSQSVPLRLDGRHANATLLMLARNSDLEGALSSVRELEARFNHHFNYPWTFLNDVPFDDEFMRRMRALIKGPVTFGMIPREHWVQAEWINETKAAESRQKMADHNIIYGDSLSYRNMCRFNSGFFFKHPLLQQYRWYWRVEPDVRFYCDIRFDPFLYMEDYNKTYGFTVALQELEGTIRSLWQTTKDFIQANPHFVAPNNAMDFISGNRGRSYNLCHFWSNFEIADMEFWRGEAYQAYFDHLEASGGFYYERWGDAPVHSIAAALFLPKDRIHFFEEIGYEHTEMMHCPRSESAWTRGSCACERDHSFDYTKDSCLRNYDAAMWW